MALPSGTLIDGIGKCDLTITTKSDKARRLAQQGFALMHCFWFNEAVRSFRDATHEDPACATAWMGLNISLTLPWYRSNENRAEADYAIKRAVETCGSATDLEQAMIAAFRSRSWETDDREGDFEKSMMRVIEDHPDAFEPRLLLAGIRTQLCMHAYDENLDPKTELSKVLALIQPVLKRDPHNAAALHYHIHSMEGSEPEKAVSSADWLTKMAPASGHMVHMPGHIYFRVGQYAKARESFMGSVRVHEEYARKIPGATPNVDWNYSHDVDFLIADLAEMGRLKEGEEFLQKNPGSRRNFEWRTGQWDKLAKASQSTFFRGMAALQAGNLEEAAKFADKLDETAKPKLAATASKWNVTDTRDTQAQADELRGLLLSRQGKHDEACDKLAEAVGAYRLLTYDEPPTYARPPYETQGEVELAAGHPDAALKAYQEGLHDRPNSGWMLYGIAKCYEAMGKAKETQRAYRAFLAAWKDADPDLPEVVAAKAYLER